MVMMMIVQVLIDDDNSRVQMGVAIGYRNETECISRRLFLRHKGYFNGLNLFTAVILHLFLDNNGYFNGLNLFTAVTLSYTLLIC